MVEENVEPAEQEAEELKQKEQKVSQESDFKPTNAEEQIQDVDEDPDEELDMQAGEEEEGDEDNALMMVAESDDDEEELPVVEGDEFGKKPYQFIDNLPKDKHDIVKMMKDVNRHI